MPHVCLRMRRRQAMALFVPYMMFLLYLTVVQHPALLPRPSDRVQWVPLRSIVEFGLKGGWPLVVNILGNLGAFMPLGFLLPSLRGEGVVTNATHAALAGGSVSVAIEAVQYAEGRRVADIDDVILNLLGALLGYLVLRGASVWRYRYRSARSVGASS